MGQAKKRGSFEERRAKAIAANELAEKIARLRARATERSINTIMQADEHKRRTLIAGLYAIAEGAKE